MFAAAGSAIFARVASAALRAGFASCAGSTTVARFAFLAGTAIFAGLAGLAWSAWGTFRSSGAWWTGWTFRTGDKFASIAGRSLRAGLTIGARWSRWAACSLRAGLSIAAWFASFSGWSVASLGTDRSNWARLRLARAWRWNWYHDLVSASVFAVGSFFSIFAVVSIFSVLAWLAWRAAWSTLARAALADFAGWWCSGRRLPSHTHEGGEGRLGSFGRDAAALVDVQHLFPHITRARFAEFHFSLYAGLQRLDVVEDQRERQQAGGDGHRAEDDGDERHDSQRRVRVHFAFFHLFVFAHFVKVATKF